jgi:hypothetical protein
MADAVETIKAWQCVGCGKLEAPAQCIGVCRDELVQLVNVNDYRAAVARAEALEAVVRRIALTSPKAGEGDRTWRALQAQAKAALGGEVASSSSVEGPLAKSPENKQ